MNITIIFPGRAIETTRGTGLVMPMATTLLAALLRSDHDVTLFDVLGGDKVDYEKPTDLVAITVRTPLAPIAYQIADNYLKRKVKVVLGGPHTFTFPSEAKKHASSVTIGEGETLWPAIVADKEKGELKDYYVSGPYKTEQLRGSICHLKERPSLEGLPHARRDLLPRARYFMDSIFTTRGCPNGCRFCPVTNIFGGKIRHRPVQEVIAEVETLGPRFFMVDDSVFGHPQMVDHPEENQYYLDLYREMAKLRPTRLWSGAGGLSAVDYKDGRKILELAARSGLSSIAAGLESITVSGQKQSGAWRKLHQTSPETFDLKKLKESVRIIQSFGIEVRGFFVIGWDSDTVETYQRTLEFCDECKVTPYISTLTPMPGSKVYEEYVDQGRLLPEHGWDHYGSGHIVYRHPTMSPYDMYKANSAVVMKGYSLGRIFKRALLAARYRPSIQTFKVSFFTQLAMKKIFTQFYDNVGRSFRAEVPRGNQP